MSDAERHTARPAGTRIELIGRALEITHDAPLVTIELERPFRPWPGQPCGLAPTASPPPDEILARLAAEDARAHEPGRGPGRRRPSAGLVEAGPHYVISAEQLEAIDAALTTVVYDDYDSLRRVIEIAARHLDMPTRHPGARPGRRRAPKREPAVPSREPVELARFRRARRLLCALMAALDNGESLDDVAARFAKRPLPDAPDAQAEEWSGSALDENDRAQDELVMLVWRCGDYAEAAPETGATGGSDE